MKRLKRGRIGAGVVVLAAAVPGGAAGAAGVSLAVATPQLTVAAGHFVTPPTTAQCVKTTGLACYSPIQLQAAYGMGTLYGQHLDGTGKTIVLVDSFGSPTIAADLAHFDKDYGLAAPPSFTEIQPAGKVPAFNPANAVMVNWAVETSLDVEYAHAMAPGAKILLVETPVAETEGVVGFPEIVKAENYVINHGLGDVISQSFGATEGTFPSVSALKALRTAYVSADSHNVTVLAATGDEGATAASNAAGTKYYTHPAVIWPATDPLVTAVGGTQLHLTQAGVRTKPDNVWNDTALLGSLAAGGGGSSTVFARPAFQDGVSAVTGAQRGIPDVALSAAVNGGASVYMSFGGLSGAGYYTIGGTSEATPLFAGIVAIADQGAGHDLGLLNAKLYSTASSGLVDITKGNNTVSFLQGGKTVTVTGFAAVAGYDLSSGLGTPNAPALVQKLDA